MRGVLLEARDKALAYANRIRAQRAELRRQIADGSVKAQEVILDPPEEMQTASLSYVLRSVKGAADQRVAVVCRDAGVSESKRLCDLTSRQRNRVVEEMDKWTCFR